MGGEEGILIRLAGLRFGLPPRGRGRVLDKRARKSADRITPAWAGKRRLHIAIGLLIRDYPRVGGEESTETRTAIR